MGPEMLQSLLSRRDTQFWLTALTAASLVIAFTLFPAEWSLLRRALAGLLMGVGSAFCVFMPRMIGGSDFN